MSDNGQRLVDVQEITRQDLFREVDRLTSDVISLSHKISTLSLDLQTLKRNIKSFQPERNREKLEKRGRFSLGDKVWWVVKNGVRHEGIIILVVDPRNYPDIQFKQSKIQKKYNIRTRGYYRYEESYVVEDNKGQQWWPRVGWLHRE